MSLALVYSCSKDSLNEVDENHKLTHKSATTDYLDDFYGVAYTLGDAIETTDEAERTFDVFPVTLSGDTVSRGYLAVDGTSGDLVYFVDVDRANYVMTAEDIEQGVTTQYNDINNHEDWEGTQRFDFTITIGDPNGDPGPPHGRKFFGRDEYNVGPCLWGKQTRSYDFYIFFIKVSEGNELPDRPC